MLLKPTKILKRTRDDLWVLGKIQNETVIIKEFMLLRPMKDFKRTQDKCFQFIYPSFFFCLQINKFRIDDIQYIKTIDN